MRLRIDLYFVRPDRSPLFCHAADLKADSQFLEALECLTLFFKNQTPRLVYE